MFNFIAVGSPVVFQVPARSNKDCALVSMVYNRGNKIEGDTRKEMKAIVGLVAKADYAGIAEEIEKSKRLWEGLKLEGLVTRREAEADLIRDSIA